MFTGRTFVIRIYKTSQYYETSENMSFSVNFSMPSLIAEGHPQNITLEMFTGTYHPRGSRQALFT